MCKCGKHRKEWADSAENRGLKRTAALIRRVPTHEERMAWMKRTAADFERRMGRNPRRSL